MKMLSQATSLSQNLSMFKKGDKKILRTLDPKQICALHQKKFKTDIE
jgi:hypothetical protein